MRYSFDTVSYLVTRCPGVRFVWIMGADNLRSFHRWQNWRGIAELVPMAVVDRLGPEPLFDRRRRRPGAVRAHASPNTAASSLADRRPPAWVFLHGLKSPLSSTALRARAARAHHESQKCRRIRAKLAMSECAESAAGAGDADTALQAGPRNRRPELRMVETVNGSHIS